jgi:hypothetical protein
MFPEVCATVLLADGEFSRKVTFLTRVHRFGVNTSEIAIFPWNQGTTNSKRISGTFTRSCWKPGGGVGVKVRGSKSGL